MISVSPRRLWIVQNRRKIVPIIQTLHRQSSRSTCPHQGCGRREIRRAVPSKMTPLDPASLQFRCKRYFTTRAIVLSMTLLKGLCDQACLTIGQSLVLGGIVARGQPECASDGEARERELQNDENREDFLCCGS